jgi:hypothetical protein
MDIPVSRLNHRMALHTPAEFPLGLVFVVGTVENVERPSDDAVHFLLSERGYQLRCKLVAPPAAQLSFADGQRVRVTGRLTFDPLRVDYYLLARDLELLADPPQQRQPIEVAPILADMRQKAQEANLAPAHLPDWVQELAPPEFRGHPELPQLAAPINGQAAATTEEGDGAAVVEDDTAVTPGGLSVELQEFLSKAIDADEDVELTPALMAEYEPQFRPDKGAFKVVYPYDASPSPAPERIHWLIAAVVLVALVLILLFVSYLALDALWPVTNHIPGGR